MYMVSPISLTLPSFHLELVGTSSTGKVGASQVFAKEKPFKWDVCVCV